MAVLPGKKAIEMAADNENQRPGKKVVAATNPRMEQLQRRLNAAKDPNRPRVTAQQFVKEAWHELQPPRTAWPSPKVLQKSTAVVLALILAVGVWVGSLDFILTKLFNQIFNPS
jgi:preprotein translocase SecE subunit